MFKGRIEVFDVTIIRSGWNVDKENIFDKKSIKGDK